MELKINNIKNVTIPKEIFDSLKLKHHDLVRVIISKGNKTARFFTRIRKEKRITIRKNARKQLNLRPKDIIEFQFKRLEITNNSASLIRQNQIDLTSIIPKITMKGIIIDTFVDGNKIITISRAKTSQPVEINHFVPLSFCKFLGFFQAEGEKFVNKNGGASFAFANIQPKICKFMISMLIGIGLPIERIIVRVLIPKSMQSKEANSKIKNFSRFTKIPIKNIRKNFIDDKKILFDRSDDKIKIIKIKNIAFVIRIHSDIFKNIVMNGIFVIRKFLSSLNSFNNAERKMAIDFLGGIIMGDGVIGIGREKRRNKTKIHIEIKDPNILNLRECSKIFRTLGFKTTLKEREILPKLIIRCNWNNLLSIVFAERMISEHTIDFIKVIATVRRHKKWIQFLKLKQIRGSITSRELSEIFGVTKMATKMWLRLKEKEGFVKGVKINNKIVWKLTKKGKSTIKLLDRIENSNMNIKNSIGTNDFDEIRQKIKNLSMENLSKMNYEINKLSLR